MPSTAKLGVQPVRSAGALHSGARTVWHLGASDCNELIMSTMQICTKWKLQSEALTRTHGVCSH